MVAERTPAADSKPRFSSCERRQVVVGQLCLSTIVQEMEDESTRGLSLVRQEQ